MPNGWSRAPAWLELISHDIDIQQFYDLQQYNHSNADIKIAIYEVDWSVTHDGVEQSQRESYRILDLSRGSDWIFVIESEPHSNYLINLRLKNVTWLTSGLVRRLERQSASWQYHLWRISKLYRDGEYSLQQLCPSDVKPRFFDALLGTKKPHRGFVWEQVQARQLAPKFIMTMEGNGHDQTSLDFMLEPGMESTEQARRNIHRASVKYHDQIIHIACVVPVRVYNHTAYSVVAETDHDNDALIVTEKLAKPMLARRLFVAFTGRGYLQYIRQLGFRTFDGIIDERYDQIEDNHARWSAAMDQVEKLCNKDQRLILDKIKPIVDHNHDLMMNSDYFVKSAVDVLVTKINSIVKAKDDSCRTSM